MSDQANRLRGLMENRLITPPVVDGTSSPTATHARSIAVTRGCESVLHVDAAASRVWVTVCKLAGPGQDTIGIIDNLSSRYGVVFSSTGDSILFTPQGIAYNAAWITMTFSKEGYDALLEISPLGRSQW